LPARPTLPHPAHLCTTLPPPARSPLFPYTTLFRSPDGRFSAIGTVAVSDTGSSRAAAAIMVATTAAAPAMSLVMWSMIAAAALRSEEHTSELQSRENLVCRLLLEKKK